MPTDSHSTIKSIYKLELAPDDGGSVIFSENEAVMSWINTEYQAWDWLQKNDVVGDETLISIAREFKKPLDRLKALVESAKGDASVFDLVNAISHLNALSANKFFTSSTLRAKVLKKIYEEDGQSAAHYALAYARNKDVPLTKSRSFNTALKYQLLANGIDANTPALIATAFEAERNAAKENLKTIERSGKGIIKQLENTNAEFQEVKENLARLISVSQRWGQHKWKIFKKKKELDLEDEVTKLHTVKKTYTDFMKLSGPVQYWNDKAKAHSEMLSTRRNLLLGYVVVGPCLFFLCLMLTWDFIQKLDKVAVAPFALLLFVSTILIWIGRILVRLYLSELHLEIDAKERAVMANTYLALIQDNHADGKTDREFILKSLFRPTSDGIIKDDGAPNFTPSTIISGQAVR